MWKLICFIYYTDHYRKQGLAPFENRLQNQQQNKQLKKKPPFTKSTSACIVTMKGLELCSQVVMHPEGKQTKSALRRGNLSSANGCEKQIVYLAKNIAHWELITFGVYVT